MKCQFNHFSFQIRSYAQRQTPTDFQQKIDGFCSCFRLFLKFMWISPLGCFSLAVTKSNPPNNAGAERFMGHICRCYSSSSGEVMVGTQVLNWRRETDAKDREACCRSISLCALLAFFLFKHKVMITCPQWAYNFHTDHQLRKCSKKLPKANLVKAIPQLRFTLISCHHPFVKKLPRASLSVRICSCGFLAAPCWGVFLCNHINKCLFFVSGSLCNFPLKASDKNDVHVFLWVILYVFFHSLN